MLQLLKRDRETSDPIPFPVQDTGAVSVMEATINRLREELAVFIRRASRDISDLGSDAPHAIGAALEEAASLDTRLGLCMCDVHDEKLATWLHPDAQQRCCGACSMQFAPCDVCGRWMRADAQVTVDGVAGHDDCVRGVR